MEVKEQNPIWLNESHPNYLRWKRARDLSVARGRFVESIINQKVTTKNLSVLDLGSGEGGTAKVFSENNFVVSFDLSLVRLQRQKLTVISAEVIPLEAVEFKYAKTSHRAKSRWKFIKKCSSSSPLRLTYVNFQTGSEERELYTPEKSTSNIVEDFSLADSFEMTSIKYINGDALHLPFSNHSFDLIIIQDVIEHLIDTDDFYSEIKRVLKPNGTIYLSTPNKFSIFNFLSDPHFGLPIISILKRESIKNYFLKYFRKGDYNRTDIAQLLSLNDLETIFKNDFKITLQTKFSVQELFKGNKGIVWSSFHLKLIGFCKSIKIDRLINKVANDKIGIINKYFTPTFYIILRTKYESFRRKVPA